MSESTRLPRKLAAILYADVAGYSRLTGEDEDATHRQLSEYLDVISSTVEGHRGRVMHYAGDAVLAMFEAVVDALSCAAHIQRNLENRNQDLPQDRKVQFRIGVNMGDVIEDRGDIYGDGVNVAARLESLAEAGGICISESVHTALGSKLPMDYDFLGEQEVKNIKEPVKAYRARLQSGAEIPSPPPGADMTKQRPQRRAVALALALVVLLAATGVLMYWAPWTLREEPASVSGMAFPLPEQPSIAVLPLDNLSGDSEQDYFVDGMTDTLITTLSRLPNLFVIARNSTFTYRDKPVKVQRVAEDLGVRYVLEGSMQRSGDAVRINAQLIDALSGRHVWAKQYDREVNDIFALQDDIAQNVATTMEVKLTEGEQARTWRSQTKSAEAYDIYARGMQLARRFTPADNTEAQYAFLKAVTLDPGFVAGWIQLAWTYFYQARFGWSDDSATSWVRAKELAEKALTLDDSDPDAFELLASVAMHVERDYDKAIAYCEKVVSLNPGASALAGCAGKLNYAGRPDKALPLIERAMRLSPHYPAWYLLNLGNAHRLMRDYDQALQALEAWRDRNPENTGPHIVLAYTYAEMGRIDDAQAEAEKILKRNPKFSLEQQVKQTPYKDPRELQRTLDGLRAAGIPERPPPK